MSGDESIGTFGNMLVLLVTRKQRMRTVTNVFIANLALADLAVCVFSIPISLAYTSLGYWPFGQVLCQTMPYLQGVTVCASVGTLTAIACDRFIVIVYPTKRKLKISQTWMSIAFIWGLSAVVTIPVNLHSEVVDDNVEGINRSFCMEIWPSRVSQLTYAMIVFLVLFLLPLCAMSIMYAAIIYKLKKLHPTQQATLRTHKKVVKMLVVVIVTFAVCWIPYHVTFLYYDILKYDSATRSTEELTNLVLFIQWLMYANSACNPIVYAVCNLNYRKEFIHMLKCSCNS
ncbi:QRFP-like peptide receptor isoform X2 [Exaiptasia diaphana]|uniref:G-protein coupled receptors family 1 profile domain-containing protein n=1 Tax=Exaiptasia diaphana TaxID=2652724 RepID=A0A913YJV1_EXADI|nr:QRFP-like peptide receptor isoform X2 [Exaiptasia diaphana]